MPKQCLISKNIQNHRFLLQRNLLQLGLETFDYSLKKWEIQNTTLKYQIEVHVHTINFWLLFRPVRAYYILYVYYFSKFFHNCKIFFYVIYNVSVKIQVFFFKSKGENDHENENTHIFLVYKKYLTLTT